MTIVKAILQHTFGMHHSICCRMLEVVPCKSFKIRRVDEDAHPDVIIVENLA